ncbi:MAG: CPBP family intramembrane metalloprotease [Alphaproteobacteria bacterium]|nr:CPBP family intramembrane metalloprotease [Alphaproteobacteria bacterium]
MTKHFLLWAEWLAIFVALPVLISLAGQRWLVFGALWVFALVGAWWLWRAHAVSVRAEWNSRGFLSEAKTIVWRFLGVACVLSLVTWLLVPEKFLQFPQQRPQLWGMVMLAYPLLSVWPQEVLFRSVFFRRYAALFVSDRAMMVASGLAFGFVHIIFHNWVAVVLSCLAGVLWANTYARTRSLAAVWVEHSLYGCFIFTVGLGSYFFTGANGIR